MSNQFFFEGDFKRRPIQNLGGRENETREELLRKVQTERLRRERDRLEAKSVRIIQATARGFISRRRHIKSQKQDYINDGKVDGTIGSLDHLGLQITRLNTFFNPLDPEDSRFYLQLLSHLDKYSKELIYKCIGDTLWSVRIIKFATKGAAFVKKGNVFTYVTPSKIFNYLKFFQKFLDEENENPDNLKIFEFNVKLWIALLNQSSIFTLFRNQFEVIKTPGKSRFYTNPEETCEIMIEQIAHVLTYISKLQTKQLTFRLKLDVSKYTIKTAQQLLMEPTESIVITYFFGQFVVNFTTDVIRIPNGKYQPCLPALLFPHLQPNFPWSKFAIYVEKEYFPLVYGEEVGSDEFKAHCLFYSTLCLASKKTLKSNPEIFLSLCNSLGRSMDLMYNSHPNLVRDDSSDMDFEEEEEIVPVQSNKLLERQSAAESIYAKLREIFEDDQFVVDMIERDQEKTHRVNSGLVSFFTFLIQLKPTNYSDFPILQKLSFNKEFLKKLFVQSLPNEPDSEGCKDEDVLFAYLFTNLMGILHDGEFLNSIPLSSNHLRLYVYWLVQLYGTMLKNDTDINRLSYSEFNFTESAVKSSKAHNSNDATYSTNCKVIVACLVALHDRNTRLELYPDDYFASASLGNILPLRTHHVYFRHLAKEFHDDDPPLSPAEDRLVRVLLEFPFVIPFDQRVACWHRMIELDKGERYLPFNARNTVQIRRNYLYEDTYEKLSPSNVPDLRNPIRISLVNTVGALEAGVDGGGLLREFLTEATKAAVDPNRGLFRFDSQNRIYPNPVAKKADPDYRSHFYLVGRLVGKALYESTLLELPLAAFFIEICINGKVKLAVDYLATLDPGLHKQLLSLKTYSGDFTSLGLDFTLTSNELGRTDSIELKPAGSSIAVDKNNAIEYIHLVADYKINKEVEEECHYFRRGLTDVVPIVRIFSWREMQTLISGSDKPINIEDWQNNTNYTGGYTADHPCVLMFWQVVATLEEDNLRKLLKFVTSCSRPPLLGFKELSPNFGIQNAGHVDRLPSAATCMNLLKLPEYDNPELMREKLVYAINAQAGFELS